MARICSKLRVHGIQGVFAAVFGYMLFSKIVACRSHVFVCGSSHMQNLVTSKSHLDGCDEENIETYTNTNIKV